MAAAVRCRLALAVQVTRAVNELHMRGVWHGKLRLEHVMVVHDFLYRQLCHNDGGLPALQHNATTGMWNAVAWMNPADFPADDLVSQRHCRLPHELKADGKLLEVDFLNILDPTLAKEKKDSSVLRDEENYNRATKCRVAVVGLRDAWLMDEREAVPQPADAWRYILSGFQALAGVDLLPHALAGFKKKDGVDDLLTLFPTAFHRIARVAEVMLLETKVDEEFVQLRDELEKKPGDAKLKHKMALFKARWSVTTALPPDVNLLPADNFPLFDIVKQVLFAFPHELATVCVGEQAEDQAPLGVQHLMSFIGRVSRNNAHWRAERNNTELTEN